MLTLEQLAPKVAAFLARGRKPRDLTQDERRLAVTAPDQFDALVLKLQAETLEDLRAEAAFGVLQDDLARAQAAERARKAAAMEAERQELLALRHEQALEMDAALQDLNASLVSFQALNGQIASLDRALGQADQHRASYGLMSLVLKRTIRTHAPDLFKLLGGKIAGFSADGLSEMSRPKGYDLAARLGEVDPLA